MPTKADVLAELARRGVSVAGLAQSTTTSEQTQDQGKALTYAKLMGNAERGYDRAVGDGYDPGTFRNSTAAVFEGLPFGGLDGVGGLIRDDVSDRARQAELQWSDAQLKAVSGAAAPEQEVKRGVKTFFPRPGETFDDIEPQKRSAREAAFTSARTRAGPLAPQTGLYPGEAGASFDQPLDLSRGQSRSGVAVGAFYRDPQGNIRRNDNADRGNPIMTREYLNQMLRGKSAAAKTAGPKTGGSYRVLED